ncbi:hypothetical protein B0H14DRAFT_2591383 [Mycena olivaceomarginata]|nr:hypothetical protein B0H14DRAFT_2591383 [Mycena olivaceomarginata]
MFNLLHLISLATATGSLASAAAIINILNYSANAFNIDPDAGATDYSPVNAYLLIASTTNEEDAVGCSQSGKTPKLNVVVKLRFVEVCRSAAIIFGSCQALHLEAERDFWRRKKFVNAFFNARLADPFDVGPSSHQPSVAEDRKWPMGTRSTGAVKEDLVKVDFQSELPTADTMLGAYPVLEFEQHIPLTRPRVFTSHGGIQEIRPMFLLPALRQ